MLRNYLFPRSLILFQFYFSFHFTQQLSKLINVIRFILLKIRMTKYILHWLFSRLVKSIHIQLSNKTIDISMSEVFRQDSFLKQFNVLDCELFSIWRPLDNFGELVILIQGICTLMISKAFWTKFATMESETYVFIKLMGISKKFDKFKV